MIVFVKKILLITISLPIALGIFSGIVLGGDNFNISPVRYSDEAGNNITVEVGQEIGSNDSRSGRDNAIGLLVKIDNSLRGTHKLIRGADALAVYLTSSVIDLRSFEERGVEVWGETIGQKEAGWFMDVVKLKVIK